MFPNIKIVEAIRKEYPAGTRVRLVKMVQTLLSFASKTGRVLLTVFRQATKTLLRT